jgi:hypothetical protein
MTTGFCPQCGTPRQGSLRYCAKCALDFWKSAAGEVPAGSSPPLPPNEPAPVGQPAPTPRTKGSGNPLLLLMLVPTVIGAVLVGFLTKFDVLAIGIGAFIGAAIGGWLIKLYMQTSNYENLRRIGRQ